ncbi:uncharacterized protein LOC141632766 [Silene latifolia]|uniref:uncharacterized protein LOC141632766 n=1 Tax=Silene latifolia TaxID=37657 RepID=UPI003D76AA6D
MDPIKYIFEKPVLNGRLARWNLMLSEFDLMYVPLKVIKGRAVAEFFADNPIHHTQVIDTWSFSDEDILHTSVESWDLYFDGASNLRGCGIGAIVSIGIKRLRVHGDSSLVINQITGSWKIRSASLAPYQARIDQVAQSFDQIFGNVQHVPPSLLYTMTSPWPFSTWGIDIVEKITPAEAGDHCYILMTIDYFTKCVEAASNTALTSKQVSKFIQPNIICRYGFPHEIINDNWSHFQAEI